MESYFRGYARSRNEFNMYQTPLQESRAPMNFLNRYTESKKQEPMASSICSVGRDSIGKKNEYKPFVSIHLCPLVLHRRG